ncbi:MAG: glutamate racemase [Bacteroidota bacterium]|nr:glutamate racemase [Bacteroidota bacterium]
MVLKKELNKGPGPIGIFDSGYGGLTILKEISKQLPQYDYLYLGDNARAPYGTRSFETVYQYTLECVNHLFNKGCHLVLLACNTASAKALRNIQQKDLPHIDPYRRVLGVIRPTTELAGTLTKTKHIGVFGTTGTVVSNSYPIEIHKFHPDVNVFQEACPMWVPLIENNEFNNEGSNYFIEKNVKALLKQSDKIDTIILGCTHYPLLENKLRQYIPQHIQLVSQGDIVAKGLIEYLKRHPEMESKCTKNGELAFYTTEIPENFSSQAGKFFGKEISAKHLAL